MNEMRDNMRFAKIAVGTYWALLCWRYGYINSKDITCVRRKRLPCLHYYFWCHWHACAVYVERCKLFYKLLRLSFLFFLKFMYRCG